ncbi:Alpha-glucosidase [[Actinomadura] parvosata subsp. kistnae]|nr:Alpha-glucosidase [Actinomadura parvosata subsp. kistnae]
MQAQQGVPGSTLELYRAALRLRRALDGDLTWRDSPEGTLVFSRGPFVCTVNLTGEPVDFGVAGELLIASDVPGAADSAAWWKVK